MLVSRASVDCAASGRLDSGRQTTEDGEVLQSAGGAILRHAVICESGRRRFDTDRGQSTRPHGARLQPRRRRAGDGTRVQRGTDEACVCVPSAQSRDH